jgi:hypothetical protein
MRQTSFDLAIASAVLLAFACGAQPGRGSKAPQPGRRPMIEVQRQVTIEEPLKVEPPVTTIKSATVPPPAKATARSDYLMPFGNASMNSRLPGQLPAGTLKAAWTAPLKPGMPASFVVQGGDRALAEGSGLWQLFDNAGKGVGEGRYGSSHVVLDPPNSLFYFLDTNNFIAAFRTGNASRLFITSPSFGETFARTLLTRKGNRFVVAGVEQQGFPHRPTEANLSVVEYFDLADKMEIDSSGLLFSLTASGKFLVHTTKLKAAMYGDTVALAVPGRVLISSSDMKMKRALEGDFEPLMLSADEAGRLYMIVTSGGTRQLWILTAEGALAGTLALKTEWDTFIAPPAVGYDHRVYLVTKAWAICADAAGKLLWEKPVGGSAAGAAVTTDGHLVVTAGAEVASFDAQGTRKVLHTLSGDSFSTPAVVTARGEVLAASRSRLYCLTSH